MSERKPTAGFWITVALLAIVVLYPLSLGPACWISSRAGAGGHAVSILYRPITWFPPACPMPTTGRGLEAGIRQYSALAAAPDWTWYAVYDGPAEHLHWEWGLVMVY
jgi:hypothetical protein